MSNWQSAKPSEAALMTKWAQDALVPALKQEFGVKTTVSDVLKLAKKHKKREAFVNALIDTYDLETKQTKKMKKIESAVDEWMG